MVIRRRGFRIGRKLVKVFRWMTRGFRRNRLSNPTRQRRSRSSTSSKILSLGKYISRGAKRLCRFGTMDHHSGYVPLSRENPIRNDVPKGHLAVYVGQSGNNGSCRVTVPVIYINHPLFGELLREAEKVHGYDHPGGITLPCGMSEFENIQSRIAQSGRGCRYRDSWRR